MQLKEKSKNEIIGHKKRLEKHRKTIEEDVKEMTTREKIIIDGDSTIKKKITRKKAIDKKAMKEKQKIISEKAMDSAHNIYTVTAENPHEGDSRVIITKEERAERFKRLHAIAQDMINKKSE